MEIISDLVLDLPTASTIIAVFVGLAFCDQKIPKEFLETNKDALKLLKQPQLDKFFSTLFETVIQRKVTNRCDDRLE